MLGQEDFVQHRKGCHYCDHEVGTQTGVCVFLCVYLIVK